MSARTIAVSAATVLGLGAVFALNPADAKSEGRRQQSSSVVTESPSGSSPVPQGQAPARNAPVGSHDFSLEWSDENGWHGTWDDDARRPHRPPPDTDGRGPGTGSDGPGAHGSMPAPAPSTSVYNLDDSGGRDDDWFEYEDDDLGDSSDDDGGER